MAGDQCRSDHHLGELKKWVKGFDEPCAQRKKIFRRFFI
jgi:hypothetical protein